MAELEAVVEDQYLAAQVYYGSVVGMLVFESLFQLPSYLSHLRHKGRTCPEKKPSNHNPIIVAIHKFRTLPSLFPSIITTHRLTTLLRLALFVGLNFLFSWTRLKFGGDFKRSGWMCIANGGLALLISPRGTNLLSLILRIPTDTLLIYHRWAGRATVIHGILHFGLNVELYVRTEQLESVVMEKRIQVGIMAFAVLVIIFFSSLAIVRRKAYEVFFFVHFLFIAYVVGAAIHAPHGPEFLFPGLVLWALDRIYRSFAYFKQVRVREVKVYDGEVTKLTLEGVETKRAGMMVWVLLPGASWNWHPFTISPNVASDMEGDENTAVIAIRGLGKWTRSIQMLADSASDASEMTSRKIKVRIDGPHRVGKMNWGDHPVTMIVAGGIGITPGISIAADILRNSRPRVANSCSGEWHIHLLWVVKHNFHIDWFAKELTTLAEKAGRSNVTLDITVHVTSGDYNQLQQRQSMELMTGHENIDPHALGYAMWKTVTGRPDLTAWFAEVKSKRSGLGGAVSVCGPRSLVLGTRKAAVAASTKSGLFRVEEEVFEV